MRALKDGLATFLVRSAETLSRLSLFDSDVIARESFHCVEESSKTGICGFVGIDRCIDIATRVDGIIASVPSKHIGEPGGPRDLEACSVEFVPCKLQIPEVH